MDIFTLFERNFVIKPINYCFKDIKYVLKTFTSIIIIDKKNDFHELNIFSDVFRHNIMNFNPENYDSMRSMFVNLELNENIVDMSYGFLHFFAITDNHKVYGWGNNFHAQLGNERLDTDDKNYNQPELNKFLSELNITSIKCGSFHSLALTLDGEVYAWGNNSFGQIGNGSRKDQNVPIKIDGFNGDLATMISCGRDYSMALTKSCHVFGWGCNEFGQLGDIDGDESVVPIQINLSGKTIMKISCGQGHSLLLSDGGEIYTLGNNCCGQLGLGNRENQRTPVKLNHEKKFVDIDCHWSKDISIALSSDEIYYAWGECGIEDHLLPIETGFKSSNDLFDHYSYYNLSLSQELTRFEFGFIRDGFFEKYFKEPKKLGEGSYGSVFEVQNNKQLIFKTKEKHLAVKKITFKKEHLKEFIRELLRFLFVFKLSRIYVVEHLRFWLENIPEDKMIFFIAMQLCDKSLKQIMEEFECNPNLKIDGRLTLIGYYIVSQMFIEIIECAQHLHENNVIHRDLSPNNIMLKIDEDNRRCIKIIDFGLIAIQEFAELKQEHSSDVGTIKYQAPEVIEGKVYDTKADIFSLGLILEQLFCLDDKR